MGCFVCMYVCVYGVFFLQEDKKINQKEKGTWSDGLKTLQNKIGHRVGEFAAVS